MTSPSRAIPRLPTRIEEAMATFTEFRSFDYCVHCKQFKFTAHLGGVDICYECNEELDGSYAASQASVAERATKNAVARWSPDTDPYFQAMRNRTATHNADYDADEYGESMDLDTRHGELPAPATQVQVLQAGGTSGGHHYPSQSYGTGWGSQRHMRIRLWHPAGGAEEHDAKVLFHGAVKHLMDKRDYPIDPMYKASDTVPRCTDCKGLVYPSPIAFPARLRLLAHQLGLKIKIDGWRRAFKCKGHIEHVSYKEIEGSLL